MLTHALAFSASQFVLKKKSPQIYTSMHSGGLTKLTYTRLEDNLIRHRGDRLHKLGQVRKETRSSLPTDEAHPLVLIVILSEVQFSCA